MPGDNVPDIDRDRPTPLICASVTGATAAELRANRDRVAGADLIELRLDYVDRPDIAGALAGRTAPVIVTCRPTWEGGRFAGSERERLGLLGAALAAGAEYVDVEWRAEHQPLIRRHGGDRIVISTHDFEGIPNDIGDRYRAMRATGAAVVKVAAATRGLCDTLALAALGRGAAERRVVIGMGPAGVASRVLAGRFGSCWTYAGEGVAPGQIELPRLRDEYRFPAITRRTAIYGVVGAPVSHSLSPAMHNAGFAEAGLDAVYLPLEARDVDDFVQFAAAVPLRGVSVTAPFKEALAARVTTADPVGKQVGAINTIRCGDTGWYGLNTDVPGFVETLLGRMRLRGVRAAVLGAGGAARAVAVGLAGEGAVVAICARDGAKGAAAAAAVGVAAGDYPPPAGSWGLPVDTPPAGPPPGGGATRPPAGAVRVAAGDYPPRAGSWDLLVNTTPAGTWPDVEATPLPGGPFSGRLVYDLVYNPATTRLLADAAAAGCDTIGGLDMLVAQAVRQFAWWTGRRPAGRRFREAAERELAGRAAPGARDGEAAGKATTGGTATGGAAAAAGRTPAEPGR